MGFGAVAGRPTSSHTSPNWALSASCGSEPAFWWVSKGNSKDTTLFFLRGGRGSPLWWVLRGNQKEITCFFLGGRKVPQQKDQSTFVVPQTAGGLGFVREPFKSKSKYERARTCLDIFSAGHHCPFCCWVNKLIEAFQKVAVCTIRTSDFGGTLQAVQVGSRRTCCNAALGVWNKRLRHAATQRLPVSCHAVRLV